MHRAQTLISTYIYIKLKVPSQQLTYAFAFYKLVNIFIAVDALTVCIVHTHSHIQTQNLFIRTVHALLTGRSDNLPKMKIKKEKY